MTNKREMAIRQTGMRTYQVEVKLLEEIRDLLKKSK